MCTGHARKKVWGMGEEGRVGQAYVQEYPI